MYVCMYGTFTHCSQRLKTLTTFIKTYRRVIKSSILGYTMSLVKGQILKKNWLSSCLIGCVRFAMYCSKMYSRHLFSYGGLLSKLIIGLLASSTLSTDTSQCAEVQYHIIRPRPVSIFRDPVLTCIKRPVSQVSSVAIMYRFDWILPSLFEARGARPLFSLVPNYQEPGTGYIFSN